MPNYIRGLKTRLKDNISLCRILIVDDHVVPLTLALVRCLGAVHGVRSDVLSLVNKRLPAFRLSRYVADYRFQETHNDQETINLICQVARENKTDVVIPVKEKTVRILSENICKLENVCKVIPLPEPRTLEMVRNKWILYNWLFENGFLEHKPVELKIVLSGGCSIRDLMYPLLIKPFWGSGGRGIVFIKTPSEFEKFIASNTDLLKDDYLIQPFLVGNDIDISLLAKNGEIFQYVIQRGIDKDKGFTFSKSIEFLQNETLLAVTRDIIRKIGYTGVAHLDFRFSPTTNKYNLIDFNARFWSSLLGSLHVGVNFPWLTVQTALDIEVQSIEYQTDTFFMGNPLRQVGHIIMHRNPNQSYRNSEIKYILKDPLPLVSSLLGRIMV